MQFIKILFWVLLLVATFIFWWTNEARSSLDLGAAVVEARVSTFVVGAFLLGFVPTWLLLRGSKWRLSRRIKTLEDAARPAVTPTPSPTPPASRAPTPTATTEPAPAVSSVSTDKATGL
ncbi:LapA family protein [uncultured Parasphingorhabdus sp.]|uniref:LapA family protein n=1 Tax=uncultured Parasphingorhabdus sp. TaxID=2709694 RepID=UPI0030DD2DB3|tara:strand:- start:15119 stop:15475 length:357 start_codon:yes stop_codon:yes gene_type:complete